MRILVPICLFVAACSPTLSTPPEGVGFGNYVDYAAQREAQLSGGAVMSGPSYPATTALSGPGAVSTGPIPGPVTSGPAASGPIDTNHSGISDEQSFSAVSGRETIESDKERLARQRAAYQVVAPTALPARPGATGPSIVAYALSTTNRRGEPAYRRSGGSAAKAARACARYTGPDLAQEAFLKAGGPERDPNGVDPDGDGFACSWDPAPFRTVRR